MHTFSIDEARAGLAQLLAQTAASHEPVAIADANVTGVLLSEADWRSVQETLHLLAVPGMRDSIREGLAEPVERCAEEAGW
ncbi:MAG TPA: type II toxin-antitoxin system Phd/YefM family antitoxin [Chthoniobacteraceae bacterium]|nr:type II toxin-antitoxin system Phd/YefM family antitoxin [Chthoniobacteraceae bacterium]